MSSKLTLIKKKFFKDDIRRRIGRDYSKQFVRQSSDEHQQHLRKHRVFDFHHNQFPRRQFLLARTGLDHLPMDKLKDFLHHPEKNKFI